MKLTLIANAGFLLEIGGIKLLFDSFHTQACGPFSAVPDALIEAVTGGGGRFSHIDAVIVTHAHPDHNEDAALAAFLTRNKNTRLIFPAKDDVNNAEYGINNIKITAGRLRHDGDEYSDFPNYGFYIQAAEKSFLTLGDAAPDMEEIARFLNGRKVDACALNFPFFALKKGRDILRFINPKFAVAVHLPFESHDERGYKAAVERALKADTLPFKTAILSEPLSEAEFD